MTDKETIIDGVDVAGCKYFNRFRSICHNKNLCCDCEKNQDCYFKQHARKTQECKESKAYAQRQENQRETYYKEFLKLSQECENLKAEEKYLKQCCQKAGEELAKHSFEYDGKEKNLVVQAIELNEKYEKFKKALEEIEEHYEKVVKNLTTYDDSYDANISIEALHNISSIINKAKGETNA